MARTMQTSRPRTIMRKPEIDEDVLLQIVIELKKEKGWKRIQWKTVAEHYIRKTGKDATNDKAFQKKLGDAFRNYRYDSKKHLQDAYKHYQKTKDTSQLKEVLSVDSVGKLDINVPFDSGYALLYNASRNGHAEVVSMLLAMPGIDVNKDMVHAYAVGTTPLYIASRLGRAEVVSMLLAMPDINVNKAADGGWTPLYIASQNGRAEVVSLLLGAQGVDVNQAADGGATPLWIASGNGRAEVVSMLLATQGVKVNQAEKQGCTPLLIASRMGHTEVVSMLLAKQGVKVNQAAKDGTTPLFIASYKGHAEVVSLLLAMPDIKVNRGLHDGRTPLLIASHAGHAEVVLALLTWMRGTEEMKGDYLSGHPVTRKGGGNWILDGEMDIGLVDGRIHPDDFRRLEAVPTKTFTLNARDVTLFTDEIDAPVRCVPCMHPHEASSLHRWLNTPMNPANPNRLHKGCPLCQKAPEYVEFMSKLQVERWNNMERASSEYEQELKRLRPLLENSSSNAVYKQFAASKAVLASNRAQAQELEKERRDVEEQLRKLRKKRGEILQAATDMRTDVVRTKVTLETLKSRLDRDPEFEKNVDKSETARKALDKNKLKNRYTPKTMLKF